MDNIFEYTFTKEENEKYKFPISNKEIYEIYKNNKAIQESIKNKTFFGNVRELICDNDNTDEKMIIDFISYRPNIPEYYTVNLSHGNTFIIEGFYLDGDNLKIRIYDRIYSSLNNHNLFKMFNSFNMINEVINKEFSDHKIIVYPKIGFVYDKYVKETDGLVKFIPITFNSLIVLKYIFW